MRSIKLSSIIQRDKLIYIALFLSVMLIFQFALYWFNAHQRTVFSWDEANYHHFFVKNVRRLAISDAGFWNDLRFSLSTHDYNSVSSIPLLPLGLLVGTSRHHFQAYILLLYGGACFLALSFLLKRILFGELMGSVPVTALIGLSVALTFLLMPYMIYPVFRGFWAILGVVFALLIYGLTFRCVYGECGIKTYLVLGTMIPLPFFVQRWFLIWVASFVLVFGLLLLSRAIITKSLRRLVSLGLMMLTALAMLKIWVEPILWRIVSTDYSSLYRAYRFEPFKRFLYESIDYYGLFVLLLMLLGYALMLKGRLAIASLSITVQCLITLGLFLRVQNMDAHQHNLFMIFILIGLSFACFKILSMKNVIPKLLLFGISVAVFVSFHNWLPLPSVYGLFPSAKATPERRDDIAVLKKLADDIAVQTAGGPVYVLSYSGSFNRDLVTRVYFDDFGTDISDRLLDVSEIDYRDPFPYSFFTAKSVYVATPPQFESTERRQKVIDLLHGWITEGDGRKHYQVSSDEYHLDWNTTVQRYQLTGEIPEDVIQDLANRYAVLLGPSSNTTD
jgi:hypothetical protein